MIALEFSIALFTILGLISQLRAMPGVSNKPPTPG
jgi:hypothetical protein